MFKITRKHIFYYLFLLILISVFLTSCRRNTSLADTSPTESEKLLMLTTEIFQTELKENTLNLHYTLAKPDHYGIADYPIVLGDFGKDTYEACLSRNSTYSARLKKLDRTKLSKSERLTLDTLLYSFDLEKEGSRFRLYEEYLSPVLGVQAQLPILLAEYPFRCEKDILVYLKLLSKIGGYYDSLLEFEKEKAGAGLFMSEYAAEEVIEQCTAFVQSPLNHFLITTFEDKLEGFSNLTPENKKKLKNQNISLVLSDVLPAYQRIADTLTELKAFSANQKGLCHFPEGKPYYEYLVKKNTGSSRSVPEIMELLNSQYHEDIAAVQKLTEGNSSVMTSSAELLSFQSPLEMLADLENKLEQEFPAPPAVHYQVKYVDKALEKYLSPAFYLTPAIDDISNHVIYINKAYPAENLSLYTTLAHEGYPGHLYQNLITNEARLDPVRSLLNFGGYSEGWATYVEMKAYQMAKDGSKTASLLQLNNSLILNLYCQLDLGIHYEGWDLAKTSEYLTLYGITDQNLVKEVYGRLIEDPANYLKYYIGYLEIKALAAERKTAEKNAYDPKQFHKELLEAGPAPFPLLREYLSGEPDS